jgi:hypothetical protein
MRAILESLFDLIGSVPLGQESAVPLVADYGLQEDVILKVCKFFSLLG